MLLATTATARICGRSTKLTKINYPLLIRKISSKTPPKISHYASISSFRYISDLEYANYDFPMTSLA